MNSRSVYTTKQFFIIYPIWWLLFAAIHTLVIHKLNLSWQISIGDALISNLLLAIFGVIIILIYQFYQPGRSNWFYRIGYVLALVTAYQTVLENVLQKVYSWNNSYLIFLDQSLPFRFVIALLILSFITIINWLLYYLNEKKQNEKNQTELENMSKEAELAKLRQQIQPHFLFNSLNSINALVVTQPQEARKMVQQLSEFLRGTLKKDEEKLITLNEELKHLQLYLDIEKVRFGHRLNVNIDTDKNCEELKLPPLLIQPVVENAIKFGLYDTVGDVTIELRSKLVNGNLQISVTNPYDPQTQKTRSGNNFGLGSIQRRLYLMFARKDLLITHSENAIFTTTLLIPQLIQ